MDHLKPLLMLSTTLWPVGKSINVLLALRKPQVQLVIVVINHRMARIFMETLTISGDEELEGSLDKKVKFREMIKCVIRNFWMEHLMWDEAKLVSIDMHYCMTHSLRHKKTSRPCNWGERRRLTTGLDSDLLTRSSFSVLRSWCLFYFLGNLTRLAT